MENFLVMLGIFVPKTASELFGSLAFVIYLAAYVLYAKKVLAAEIRANAATWLMWLFGGYVEYATYTHIPGAHWATNALPLACLIGVGSICTVICIAQRKNRENTVAYHEPERVDYLLLSFDVIAGAYWLAGGDATTANAIAVLSSIGSYWPLWRTTKEKPGSERPLPWFLWSLALAMMLAAVATGENTQKEVGLYIYPAYYLVLHGITLCLALRYRK